jgi:hypothetical protein
MEGSTYQGVYIVQYSTVRTADDDPVPVARDGQQNIWCGTGT